MHTNKNVACAKKQEDDCLPNFVVFYAFKTIFFKGEAGQKEITKRISKLESKMFIRSIYLLFRRLIISGSKTEDERGSLSTLKKKKIHALTYSPCN